MPSDVEALVLALHRTPQKLVLAVSGGGSPAISWLLATPGASRTMLQAIAPYSEQAMVRWLGGRPGQFCSAPTARAMAMAAMLRGISLVESGGRRSGPGSEGGEEAGGVVLGVGCTASLVSDRPKRGSHRAHVAVQSRATTMSRTVELKKGVRDRAAEEDLVARFILNAVAEACELPSSLGLRLGLSEAEPIESTAATAPESWQRLVLGEADAVAAGGNSGRTLERVGRAIFPGAFNPVHAGHRGMQHIAQQRLGQRVDLEISIENVEKPILDYVEIQRRVAPFPAEQVIWLTRAKTFVEKSALFPGATFVVGVDTVRRIADPRFYGDDAEACRRALEEIAARGCRFLVFGRDIGTGFVGLGDLSLPEPLAAICQGVPAEVFREDISSTEIRAADQG